ncbi:MAG: redoxin domain-containing protein [bacterium]|jgi:thiol-disulfide isomerase/thioredoxin|nr:redoxin domain-containing protein [bacterium]MBK9471803.1 redoxin domain-containing protein [bacterium]
MRKYGLLMLALAALSVPGAAVADGPDKAVCVVCASHGESKPEKVAASATHEGVTYHFCATDCRDAFVADPAAYLPLPLPRPAPAFTATTPDGGAIALADFAGKVVLVDFWATWCKPCVKMMPRLQELHTAWADSGFMVLGVSVDEIEEGNDRAAKVAAFTAKHGVHYPVCIDGGETPAWSTYRVKAVPAMFLIDRAGNIVAQWTGEVDGDVVAREVERVIGLN